MKKIIILVLIVISALACTQKQPSINKQECKPNGVNCLTSWNNDPRFDTDTTISVRSIVDYVTAVTSEGSKSFIPIEDRIAVFDLDGTLACERPFSMEQICSAQLAAINPPACNTNADSLQKAIIKKFNGYLPGNITSDSLTSIFTSYSAKIKNTCIPANKPTQRVLSNQFYKPMVELVHYLIKNKFEVYVVSGSSQSFLRGLLKNNGLFASLPPSHIIGSLQKYKTIIHPDGAGPEFYLDTLNFLSDVSSGKAINIYNRIGKTPVFAFGNTTGDLDMFSLTSSNKKYKTLCVLLNHDSKDMEDAYLPYTPTGKVCKNWNQPEYCDSLWSSRIFHQIMQYQKWKIANMSQCFLKDSVFVGN
jgi:hypothetical protein